MIITYHGGECVKVTFGGTTLAFNPISKSGTMPAVRFGADIAFVSLNHADMNGVEQMAHGSKEPFVIQGPGEYEIGGVMAKGFATESGYATKGGAPRINTVFFTTLEDMNLGYLGALGNRKLPAEAKEAFDDIDILFVPVGGEGVLSPSEAHELAVALEPAVVIPIHWSGMGAKDALKSFLKEEGTDVKPIDKLTIKKKELAGKEGEIVVLSPA